MSSDEISKFLFALDDDTAAAMGIRYRPGYESPFTRNRAPGAMENGRKILKVNSKPDDLHPDGSTGIVLGSVWHRSVGTCYFVEWDAHPGVAVAVVAANIKKSR